MTRPTTRGLWIAFFGPDGVGKSAVIEQLQLHLEPAFDHVARFHFRPGFRSRAIERTPVTAPHAKSPRGLIVSLGKLLFWLVDCWYGYLMTIRPVRRSSGLVIFDRYYPDILVDPLRYRLPSASLIFARWLTALAPSPDLYVLLDAPAVTVHQRKSELSIEESHRQRIAYLKLFATLSDKLLVDADPPIQEVTRHVGAAICSFFTNNSHEARESSLLAGL